MWTIPCVSRRTSTGAERFATVTVSEDAGPPGKGPTGPGATSAAASFGGPAASWELPPEHAATAANVRSMGFRTSSPYRLPPASATRTADYEISAEALRIGQ